LRRAKNVKNAPETERDALLEDAERLENWCVLLVFAGIALEAVIAAAPLAANLSPLLAGTGNALADAAVALGVLGELRFGNVAGAVLKIKLADANTELAELHVRLAPRRISQQAEETMVTALQQFSGTEFRGAVMPSGNDTRTLWIDIWRVLTKAGWTRASFPRDAKFGTGAPWEHDIALTGYNGVFVGVAMEFWKVDGSARALAAALQEVGIDAQAGIQGDASATSKIVTITVGPKPSTPREPNI
jgi:hypothetical protein